MGRKRKIPKKIVVPTEPMVEEPLKIYHTVEAYYLDHLRSLCAHAETPTSLVEGKSLDEHTCYYYHYLLITNYLAIKLLATYNFNTCRHYLTENYLSFPSLLVGFDTLTYRKRLQLIPYTCGLSVSLMHPS